MYGNQEFSVGARLSPMYLCGSSQSLLFFSMHPTTEGSCERLDKVDNTSRHRPTGLGRKEFSLRTVRAGRPVCPWLVPCCLSSPLSPGCWHVVSVFSIQTSATWTTCTGFRPGLWRTGCCPGCCKSPPPPLIPSDSGYFLQWLSTCLSILHIFLEVIPCLHIQPKLPPEDVDFCPFSSPFAYSPVLSKGSQLLGFLTL